MSTPASAMITPFVPARAMQVSVKLNVRSAASRTAARVDRAEPGELLQVDGATQGESVNGVRLWYRIAGTQNFVWSGGVVPSTAAPPSSAQPAPGAGPAVGAGAGAPRVKRRANGTIVPLTVVELGDAFGTFLSKPAKKKGFIEIERTWVQENIVLLAVPALADSGFPEIQVHKKARPHFAAVFEEIERSGLSDTLLTCGGTFVPRHIGRDPSRPLSSHTWGVAIDLNVEWNGYGVAPAASGQIGSLRDVVPIFAAHGFAWGGDFSTPDGMHFELARKDI